MSAKIFRDPLYNYISIDRSKDRWLLELLDTPEVQRLRRIHQLGVSNQTYFGADHNRLAHSLGVVHLMQQALQHIQTHYHDEHFNLGRAPLLAGALIHDVGHGPFSHLFEPCLGIDHEVWSSKIILCQDKEMKLNKVLRSVDSMLPQRVAELIDRKPHGHPPWMKYLLSSQLDMDRLDYLRRDSLFTGAGYGHFDPPPIKNDLAPNFDAWEKALLDLVKSKAEYAPPEMYCLKDEVKAKYNQPYFPEKEADEQSVKNSIRLRIDGEKELVEISTILDRLKPLTQEPVSRVRYYIPKELQEQARKIRAQWKDPS